MSRHELVQVARGDAPADLVIQKGKLVNVNTGEIYPADVSIKGDRVVAIGDVGYTVGPDTEVIDASGLYLCPGFIDTHMHVDGSQLSMTELARTLVARGTTVLGTDFYEMGIVAGKKAIRFALDELAATPLKVLFGLPPHHYLGHGPLGHTNNISLEGMHEMLAWPECIGLEEWNIRLWDMPEKGLRELTEAALERKKVLAGHYGIISQERANATTVLGVFSEHEAVAAEQALQRAREGLHIQMREGSAGRDLEQVVKAVTELGADPRHFSFCTDEQEADSLFFEGHIDKKIRMTIASGVAPMTAVQMATLNAAEYFRLSDDLGSIGPGKIADVVLVDDLRRFEVKAVVANGRLVAQDGRYTAELEAPAYPGYFYGTIKLARATTPEDFVVAAPPGSDARVSTRVIGVTEGSLVTDDRRLDLPVSSGQVLADPGQDVIKMAVIDRHFASGRMGLAFVRGFGIRAGAIGSTFNPEQMNVMVAGTNDRDMSLVANRIAELGGGYVVARDGKILGELPLPLLGLFADEPVEEVAERLKVINQALAADLGTHFAGLHTTMAFVCLAVAIPSLKVCDRGLADVRIMEIVDMFA